MTFSRQTVFLKKKKQTREFVALIHKREIHQDVKISSVYNAISELAHIRPNSTNSICLFKQNKALVLAFFHVWDFCEGFVVSILTVEDTWRFICKYLCLILTKYKQTTRYNLFGLTNIYKLVGYETIVLLSYLHQNIICDKTDVTTHLNMGI